MIDDSILQAIGLVALAGGIGGLIGGLFATRRASLFGSFLMGVIGGIALATILRILNVDPIFEAGEGFSYIYGLGGGVLLGLVVAASNR